MGETSPAVHEGSSRSIITGLSPKEGVPGTQIKIRGENLGRGQPDLVALSICGTDCLMSAKWKSPSLIVARVGQAKRGVGDVVLLTKSMGKSTSNVKFRVFIVQVGPLEESAVWVDETRTVPGREAVRNVTENTTSTDALGLNLQAQKKLDSTLLMQMFPDGSGNLRMDNFNPAWYLLENHRETKWSDLRKGLDNLVRSTKDSEKSSTDLHRANLYSLINCVDTLAALNEKLKLERNTRGWPLTRNIADKLEESHTTADLLFREVLTRKDRADATRNALSVLTRFRFIFFLSNSIDQNLAKGEYSSILNDYTRAKSLFKDTEVSLFKEVMVELDTKMEIFKRNMKQRLIDMPTSFEDQSKLVKYLKVLEPESDPAWDCITAYHCWLEDLLWQTQSKHYRMAVNDDDSNKNHLNGFSLVEGSGYNLQDFVQEVVNLITEKLQIFWKLSQIYSSSANTTSSQDRQNDINQMLINTINVSSWLMLNALVPSSLPESVLGRYAEQFSKWPQMSATALTQQLFASLKILRGCVNQMLDCNFSLEQLQPLFELCVTLRLKCLSKIIEKVTQGVINLSGKENWKLENAPNGHAKSILPDLYENEINDCMMLIKQVLSSTNFSGELDLFTRDRSDVRRPTALLTESPVSSKKLLIATCNVEYVLNISLPALCKRFAENGVKYGDVVLDTSRKQLREFHEKLIKHYLQIKCVTFSSLIQEMKFQIMSKEDASDDIKELIMCIIFIQAELCLLAPHLIKQVLSIVVQNVFDELLEKFKEFQNCSSAQATQLVIDASALEESVQNFLSLKTKTLLNAFRAQLIDDLDQSVFQRSIRNFRIGLRMAIASLNCSGTDSNDTSDI